MAHRALTDTKIRGKRSNIISKLDTPRNKKLKLENTLKTSSSTIKTLKSKFGLSGKKGQPTPVTKKKAEKNIPFYQAKLARMLELYKFKNVNGNIKSEFFENLWFYDEASAFHENVPESYITKIGVPANSIKDTTPPHITLGPIVTLSGNVVQIIVITSHKCLIPMDFTKKLVKIWPGKIMVCIFQFFCPSMFF